MTTYVVPPGAFSFWEERLEQFDISYEMVERFDEAFLSFEDPHGLLIELVERAEGNKMSGHLTESHQMLR